MQLLILVMMNPCRCAIVPHIGSATLETRVAMATLAVNNLLAGLAGGRMQASVDLTSH